MTCCSSYQESERGKKDLNDFGHGIDVGQRWAAVSNSETADLLQQFNSRSFQTTISKVCGK